MENSLTAIAIAIGWFFALFFISRSGIIYKKHNAPKTPPTAPGGWPIIGHLHMLRPQGDKVPHKTLASLAHKCGPIFSIRLGAHRAVVVSSSELAKECFTTHDPATLSRVEFAGAKYMTYNYAMFAFSPHAAYWREIRKIATSQLLSHRRIDLLKHVRVSEVETAVHNLSELWLKNKDASGGPVLVDLNQWFSNISLNITARMVAGKSYASDATETDDTDEIAKKRRCLSVLRELARSMGTTVLSDAFPLLEKLDIGGHIDKFKRTAKKLDSIVSEWVEEHRLKKVSHDRDRDFMDVMISAVHGTDFAGYDEDTVIKATCLTIIAAGTDTTTVTLTWAMSLLLNNPRAMKNVQEELRRVVGNKRTVSESDVNELVYLQAVVKETLRLYPPAPILFPRVLTDDCIVGGYHVPKGTRLIINAWNIHHDPNIWRDPLMFKPERFLIGSGDDPVDVKGQGFELVPFGGGRRGCPGAVLGLQVLHLVLASFLHAFEISCPRDEQVDMSELHGASIAKATPLEVLVKPRID